MKIDMIIRISKNGDNLVDDDFLILFNSYQERLDLVTTKSMHEAKWEVLIDNGGGLDSPWTANF